jgi:hypothetical protein
MKCQIEVRRMQYAFVEIEVPDDATGDEIEHKAIQSVTTWKTLGSPYIEEFDDITPYPEEEPTPSL